MSVVTDADFTGQRRWLLWLFPSGGQPEVKRGSMSCLPKEDLLFCPLAWSLSWLPTWKALWPTGKESTGQFHCLLICSALGTSVKTCFSVTLEAWGAQSLEKGRGETLRKYDENNRRIWKEYRPHWQQSLAMWCPQNGFWGGNDCFLPTSAHFAFQVQFFIFLFHVSWSHFPISDLDKSVTQFC